MRCRGHRHQPPGAGGPLDRQPHPRGRDGPAGLQRRPAARETLRCIDAAALSFELFAGASVREAGVESPYELSRPLHPGEKISYFISHSWHDEVLLEAPVKSNMCISSCEMNLKIGVPIHLYCAGQHQNVRKFEARPKWEQLQAVIAQYKARHGRAPTFWLDKARRLFRPAWPRVPRVLAESNCYIMTRSCVSC